MQDCARVLNTACTGTEPVRLIQRFGRVDRIGSPHDEIHLHNMLPDAQPDEGLGLTGKLSGRIQAFRPHRAGQQAPAGRRATERPGQRKSHGKSAKRQPFATIPVKLHREWKPLRTPTLTPQAGSRSARARSTTLLLVLVAMIVAAFFALPASGNTEVPGTPAKVKAEFYTSGSSQERVRVSWDEPTGATHYSVSYREIYGDGCPKWERVAEFSHSIVPLRQIPARDKIAC